MLIIKRMVDAFDETKLRDKARAQKRSWMELNERKKKKINTHWTQLFHLYSQCENERQIVNE